MPYIGPNPAESFTSFATQEFSTSATTSYTLDHAVANENAIALFVNNVRQQPGSGKAYTATGTALTLSAATASTDTMYCVFLGRALQTVTPATNSITAAMVGNDLISGKDALTSAHDDTDEFLISDAGTLKRIDASLVGRGSLVKLAATTVSSNVANVDFTSQFTATYDVYKIIIQGARPDTDNNAIAMRFGTGSSFDTGSNYERYLIAGGRDQGNDSVDSRGGTPDSMTFNLMSSQSSGAETSTNMEITIFNMRDSAKNTYATVIGAFEGADDEFRTLLGSYNYNQTNTRDSVRFFNTSGNNIATGTFTVYGVVT